MPGSRLILRPLRAEDEATVRALAPALRAEQFPFLASGRPWSEVLELVARQSEGIDLAPGRVPSDFLVAEVDGQVVGRASIRHRLNEELRREGGHVGYLVLPGHRRRGYATEILRQSLVRLAGLGVERVLVTCDDDNVGSATVIERCGGVLADVVPGDDGQPLRRYWIDHRA